MVAAGVVGADADVGRQSATFDVDEASIALGVDVLSEAIVETVERRP